MRELEPSTRGFYQVRKRKRDPKVGTGKKPKGSGRRLYTDENPKDTVGIKFANYGKGSKKKKKATGGVVNFGGGGLTRRRNRKRSTKNGNVARGCGIVSRRKVTKYV